MRLSIVLPDSLWSIRWRLVPFRSCSSSGSLRKVERSNFGIWLNGILSERASRSNAHHHWNSKTFLGPWESQKFGGEFLAPRITGIGINLHYSRSKRHSEDYPGTGAANWRPEDWPEEHTAGGYPSCERSLAIS